MRGVVGEEARDLRVFHDVVADICRQWLHAEKFVGLVEVEVNGVHAGTVEEVAGAGEGFDGRVPGEREHVVFAVQQAAGAVAFSRCRAVAAIARKQFARAEGEDVVNVFFDNPRLAHPPAGHLPDDGVHPQEFFDFGGNVVAVVDDGFLGLVAEGGEGVACLGVQGVVEAALRRAVGFAAVDEEDVHGVSPVGGEGIIVASSDISDVQVFSACSKLDCRCRR